MNEKIAKKGSERIVKWEQFLGRFGAFISPVLFCFVLFCLDLSFRIIYNGVGIANFRHLVPNTFTLCWSVLFTVIALLLPGVLKKIYKIQKSLYFI